MAFDSFPRRSAQLLKLLMERGTNRGYFPKLAKSLFVLDTPGQEEAKRMKFAMEGIVLNFASWSRYLGAYLVPQ